MAALEPILKEINHYLGQLNTEQQKAVLGVVKTFANEYDKWTDKIYLAEMDRRFEELESGKVKGMTLGEVENSARKKYKMSKREKR